MLTALLVLVVSVASYGGLLSLGARFSGELDVAFDDGGAGLLFVTSRNPTDFSTYEVANQTERHDLVLKVAPIVLHAEPSIRAFVGGASLERRGFSRLLGTDGRLQGVLGPESLSSGSWPYLDAPIPVALLGADVAEELNVVNGETAVLIGKTPLTVVGVLAPSRALPELDRVVVVPISWLESMHVSDFVSEGAVVQVQRRGLAVAASELPETIGNGRPAPVDIAYNKSLSEADLSISTSANRLLTRVSFGVLYAGLVVSALIQARRVGQRRQEIGVMIALGNTPNQVGFLFFVESLAIGAIGVFVGAGIAALLGAVGLPLVLGAQLIKPFILGTALGFATFVAAAILPAVKASESDPVDNLAAR